MLIEKAAGVMIALLGAVVAPAEGQITPVRTLAEAEVLYEGRYTSLVGVRELSDGRVIAVDANERRILLFDPNGLLLTDIGRVGQGPKEFQQPTSVFALPVDRTAVLDGPGRFLVVTISGQIEEDELDPRPRSGRGCGTSAVGYPPQAKLVDSIGNYYTQAAPIAVSTSGQLSIADSAAIERWTDSTCGRDTVGFVPNPVGEDAILVAESFVVRDGPSPVVAFETRTQWAVAPDGRVAIVHPAPYRVDMIDADGRWRRGSVIRFQSIRVDAAIKDAWRDEMQSPTIVRSGTRDGASSARYESRPLVEPDEWPESLPPFLDHAVAFDTNGHLWVRRLSREADPTKYDVIDEIGRVTLTVSLPNDSRVLGFGTRSVYLVRKDEFDLESLERYALPTR
jgi:hypothetical protein